MTALKSDEKADLSINFAVLPRKLSYRVSRNYFSLFLFACRFVDVTFCRFCWKSFVFALSLKRELQQTTSALFSSSNDEPFSNIVYGRKKTHLS